LFGIASLFPSTFFVESWQKKGKKKKNRRRRRKKKEKVPGLGLAGGGAKKTR
jgi:hypothetical protein